MYIILFTLHFPHLLIALPRPFLGARLLPGGLRGCLAPLHLGHHLDAHHLTGEGTAGTWP